MHGVAAVGTWVCGLGHVGLRIELQGCRVVVGWLRSGWQGGLPMRLKKTTYAAGSSGSGGALEFIPMAQLNRPTPAIDGGLAAAAHTHASEPIELPTTTACAAGKAIN